MQTPFLSGISVIELAGVLAGPSVGMFFAELGAEVIKIEPPSGDVTRSWKGAGEISGDVSAYYASVNWGKKVICADLTRENDRKLVMGLLKDADIVITSFRPGSDEKLGMDYGSLKALNPKIILGRITAYGPASRRAGYDAIIQAESGFTWMNGTPEGGPVKMPVALVDLLTAHQLKEGLLAALLSRERSGEGCEVEVSLFRSAVSALANQASNYLVAGKIPQRMGSEHPNIVPYGTIFETADGLPLVIACGNDKQFSALCEALEVPQLADDPRFKTNPERVAHREQLNPALAEAFARQRRQPLLEKLETAGVPAGAVNRMNEVFETVEAAAMLLEGEAVKGVSQIAFRSGAIPLMDQPEPPAGLP